MFSSLHQREHYSLDLPLACMETKLLPNSNLPQRNIKCCPVSFNNFEVITFIISSTFPLMTAHSHSMKGLCATQTTQDTLTNKVSCIKQQICSNINRKFIRVCIHFYQEFIIGLLLLLLRNVNQMFS